MSEQELLDRAAQRDAPVRDPEAAQRALVRVQHVLEKQRRVEALVHREQTPAEQKKALVEQLVHRQHLSELRSILDRLHAADIAYMLEALPLDDRLVVWDCVKADRDGEILIEVNDAVRETLIASMDREELVDAVESLETDEIAALAHDLPADVVDEVREGLTSEERAQLRAAMSYPEDSVGALMDFEMITIREDVTLEVVLRYLRRFDELPDHTDQVFVVDRHEVLKGALPLDRLLINEPDTEVTAVMKSDLLTLSPLDDGGEAAQAFERYDLVSAPVVDASGRLVGRLTDRRGRRRHPRGRRGGRTGTGRPARRRGHLRVGLEFGQEPLAVAGGQPVHGILRQSRDQYLRRHDREGRRARCADADRRRHRRQFGQPDADAAGALAGARTGHVRQPAPAGAQGNQHRGAERCRVGRRWPDCSPGCCIATRRMVCCWAWSCSWR